MTGRRFLAGIGFPGEVLHGEQDWNAVTPRAVISYQPNDGVTLYGSVSRGFKSGGFPGRAFGSAEFKPFDPETVWTYEVGIKGRTPDNRFTYAAAYFFNDYNDLQLNGFGQDPATGQFVSLFTNAASARIQGVEWVASYRPTDRLSIDASVGYLNSEYEEFETLVNGVLTDVSSRRLPNAPEWTGFIGMTYSDQLSPGIDATAHLDIAYKGAHANESSDSPNLAVALGDLPQRVRIDFRRRSALGSTPRRHQPDGQGARCPEFQHGRVFRRGNRLHGCAPPVRYTAALAL